MTNQATSNRAVPNGVFAAFDAGDAAALDDLLAADLIDHNLPPGAPSAVDGMKGMVVAMSAAFTDLHHHIAYQADTDDGWVVTHWIVTGTHTGDWFGVAPTGRDITVSGIDLARVVDGRMTEIRHVEELLQLNAQIGG